MEYAIVPHWFAGYNTFFEILFSVVSLLVGIYALRIYKLSGQRQTKLFGVSFLMISAAYLIESTINFASSCYMSDGCYIRAMAAMHNFNDPGIYAQIMLFLAAFVTLAYMTLRIENSKAYLLFLISVISILFFSSNKLYFFYVISSILLIYISFYYLRNYLKSKQTNALIVFIAFLFLLFGKIHFIFSMDHGTFYVAGHLLEFVAYALILINLLTAIRKK